MRRFAAIALCSLLLPASASAARASWAQLQIKRVVQAGLLSAQVAGFKPKQPLTQKALALTLDTLSLASEEPVDYSYVPAAPAVRSRSVSSTPLSSASSASGTALAR